MNTYNENLQNTANKTIADLSAEKEKLASKQTTSEYNLYHAQGADITAFDKLSKTTHHRDEYQHINDEGVLIDNCSMNILASATEAKVNVAASVTNVATAASNVQIASNAIALLASDIGAALNIATASLYNTNIYKKISSANSFINDTANDAKLTSLMSMEASGDASEIIAPEIEKGATLVKGKIENLLKATEAEFNKLAELTITENTKLGKTSKAERKAEGVLANAINEALAIDSTFNNANAQLNYALKVLIKSGTEFSLNFNKLDEKYFVNEPACKITIPKLNPKYYLTMVPAKEQSVITTDLVEQIFSQTQNDLPASTSPASPTKPVCIVDLTAQFTQVEAGKTNNVIVQKSALDIYGAAIKQGDEYVVFLYTVLDVNYKQYIGNYSDILSSPSQAFVLASKLPVATKYVKSNSSENNLAVKQLYFCAKNTMLLDSVMKHENTKQAASIEFRCIFVKDSNETRFDTIETIDTIDKKHKLPIYFNIDIALQVPPSNYIVATSFDPSKKKKDVPVISKNSNKPEAAVVKEGADANQNKASSAVKDIDSIHKVVKNSEKDDCYFCVTIPDDNTDNFGDLIIPGIKYQACILAVVDGDKQESSPYIPELSYELESVVLIPKQPINTEKR